MGALITKLSLCGGTTNQKEINISPASELLNNATMPSSPRKIPNAKNQLTYAEPRTLTWQQIRSSSHSQLRHWLNDTIHTNISETLKQESSHGNCSQTIHDCPCIQRIKSVLHTYQTLSRNNHLFTVPLTPILTILNTYTIQDIVNDFLHIKCIHINDVTNQSIGKKIYDLFQTEINCDISECVPFKRHYYDRLQRRTQQSHTNKYDNAFVVDNNENVLRHQCDLMHSYLIHPWYKGENEELIIESEMKTESKSKFYIGKKQDKKWLDTFEENGYESLHTNIGQFSYQSPHGFRVGQNRAIVHIKARYANIKEEALYNLYSPLSSDNWNQTLRKSKIFNNSWAKHKIRTVSNGKYNDYISDTHVSWLNGVEITMQEIVILKLYTDFDQLQFELKQCFRHKRNMKAELEHRLSDFYHWRVGILVVLNKFGNKVFNKQNSNIALYHGVNAKMEINTHNLSQFYGPLSTSSSYHIAKTFATAKGMVLKIKSAFPRLNHCKAFDASLISDYPEESEYIIGFCYANIAQISTRPLVKDWNAINGMQCLLKNAPKASIVKDVFFAIQLFERNMFCMSAHLEIYVIGFIQCLSGMECADMNGFGVWFKENVLGKDARNEWSVLRVLYDRFEQFMDTKLRISINEISEGLKDCLLCRDVQTLSIHNKQRWVVSFDKLMKLFPNLKEIKFLNWYKLDDFGVSKLLQQIKNENNKLSKVTFLYNDYYDECPLSDYYLDPKYLSKHYLCELEERNWGWVFQKNGNIGYKIQFYEQKQKITIA